MFSSKTVLRGSAAAAAAVAALLGLSDTPWAMRSYRVVPA